MRIRGSFVPLLFSFMACHSSAGNDVPATADGGVPGDDGGTSVDPLGTGNTVPPSRKPDVLMLHKNPSKDGHYIDAAMTRAAARTIHLDAAFKAKIAGPIFAQPLYVENGANGKETLYIVSEQDIIYALDANTGAVIWQKTVGTPVAQRFFDCANIDPIGITGTPVIDITSRTIFFDSLTTPDDGTTKQHFVHAMSLDNGNERKGYPVDLEAKLKSVTGFTAALNQQRGALLLLKGGVYIPFGGYAGDCGQYKGHLVGLQIENPAEVHAWTPDAFGGGVWSPGGASSDGSSIFLTAGNQDNVDTYSYGNSVIKLGVGPTFSKSPADWFTPSNRKELDAQDLELGSTGPVVFDMPGAAQSKLVIAFGKMGNAYILDRANLGGEGKGNGVTGEGLVSAHITSNYIITSPALFTSAAGTFAIVKGAGIDCPTGTSLTAVKIGRDPLSITKAWCVDHHGEGSPIVTTTDGKSEPIVWAVGAEGSTKLHAFDGETGAVVFEGGDATFPNVARYQTPIVVKGRVIWASNDEVIAFTTR